MSKDEDHPGQRQTLIYDVAHTNVGGHYSPLTGVFSAPTHGVYVFTWNVYSNASPSTYAYTEILVNSIVACGSYQGANGSGNAITSPATVVLELNQGDEVHIRTSAIRHIAGKIYSNLAYRSTFSGWKLF
jgi:hypothetical protein